MQPQSGSNRISLPITTTTQTSVTSVTTITSQKPPFTRALSLPIGGKVSATQVRLQVSGYNNTNFCPFCIELGQTTRYRGWMDGFNEGD